MSRDGNGNGDAADLTLRLLREMRAKMATRDDLAKLRAEIATKDDVAKLRVEMATKDDLTKLEAKLGARIDVLTRIVKDHHRIFAKRVRAVEIRVGARRPR